MDGRADLDYAMANDLTIVSKDADFSQRALLSYRGPTVVHIRVGNMRLKEFHEVIERHWFWVIDHHARYRVVNLHVDRIEAVGRADA